ncbi:hypothetical protein BaRGS_00026130 [Batillaria attramentaria]|uniref:DNA mismatch repair protein MSH3 n=1 Tax=Batillaria attramentaria TaxID=370345 RepID=A0ABD0K5N0_9CAEN
MPKSKKESAAASAPKQVTISKFFAPKHGSGHQVANGITTDADEDVDQDVSSGNKSATVEEPTQKRKAARRSPVKSAKRQCVDTRASGSHADSAGSSSSGSNPRQSSGVDIRENTAKRLKAFALDEVEERGRLETRTLWQPKDLPPLFDSLSQEEDGDEKNEALVVSDNDSADEDYQPPSKSANSKGKKGSGSSKSSPKQTAAFLGKFSASQSTASQGSASASAANKRTKTKYTPLEQQYMEIKEQQPDAILLVECGYKYRFFGTDAEVAAKVLKIFCHPDHNFMTASIPVHRLFVHVRRLVAAGYKVGVVKQTETAALKAAGDNRSAPFTRRLSALYTKSTLIGEDILLERSIASEGDTSSTAGLRPNSYLMCIYDFPVESSSKQQQIGIVAVDPATGDVVYDCLADGDGRGELETCISHLAPVEILLSSSPSPPTERLVEGLVAVSSTDDDRTRVERMEEEKFAYSQAFETVSEFYSSDNASSLQDVLALPKPVVCCVAALISYLRDFNLHNILKLTSNFHQFSVKSKFLHLPAACLRNLEVFQNSTDRSERGSLYWLLNHTVTRFGTRLLRSWLAQPLRDAGEISARQDAIQELSNGTCPGLIKLRNSLLRTPDLEKGLCSIYHNKSSAVEFVSVAKAFCKLCHEIRLLQGTELPHLQSSMLKEVLKEVPDLLDDVKEFADAINEKAARENDKANLFVDIERYPEVASVKHEISNVLQEIKDYRREIRLALRQPALDYVTVNQVEFLVEVKNTQLRTVPSDWMQISSTKVVSRFHPPVVASKYKRLCQLREQLVATVTDAWQQFLREFSEGFLRYRKAVQLLAALDVLMALSHVARQDGYCRPEVTEDAVMIEIEDGRHPVIDALKGEHEQYVPNSTLLTSEGQHVMIVTGPNMGGKSSYIRQVALIAVMAQIGSFVPAASARLGILDAIFTRMGAEDEIFRGRSTFMVELQEAGEILAAATERSLVIMDELGRGTSTHDGVAIAYATLHHLITKFQQSFPDTVGNFHMAFLLYDGSDDDKTDNAKEDGSMETVNDGTAKDDGNEEFLTFLYQLTPGAAAKSYGLNVARLAQIPREVLRVAATMSHQLEEKISQRRLMREKFASAYHASKDSVTTTLAEIAGISVL